MNGAVPLKLFLIKNIKFMKKSIFCAVAVLVVSAAVAVGLKAYNHSQLSDLALANIEALSDDKENKEKDGSLYATHPNSAGLQKYCCGPGNVRDCNKIEVPPCPDYVQ